MLRRYLSGGVRVNGVRNTRGSQGYGSCGSGIVRYRLYVTGWRWLREWLSPGGVPPLDLPPAYVCLQARVRGVVRVLRDVARVHRCGSMREGTCPGMGQVEA